MPQVLIIPEQVESSDGRSFRPGLLSWRETVPLMFTDTTSEGHDGAMHVGNITGLRRATVDGDTWIVGDLAWDDDDDAREARRLAEEGKIVGVSADVAVTIEETGDLDDAGMPVFDMASAEIVGVTQLAMPAFRDARILTETETVPEPLLAAANPRATVDWFTNPNLSGPTPLTVTDDGRVYGHLATWGTCHTAFSGACVTPPNSPSGYAWFHTGAVRIDGADIPVGHVTIGTGHASLEAAADDTVAHYDNTGTCAADVTVGEDDYGIWVAGAARPDADLDALRSASLSGDWRRIDGELELVAALAVNVPGFPIPRTRARVASAGQTALVASGVVEPASRDDLIVEALRLLGAKLDALTAHVMPSPVSDDTPADHDNTWSGEVPSDSVTVTESAVESGALSRILETR